MVNFKNSYIDFEVTRNPFMIKNNIWWYVIIDENGYIKDITCTSRQYYKIYKHKNKNSQILDFEKFLELAKAGDINLK
jgi:hypothetical protein